MKFILLFVISQVLYAQNSTTTAQINLLGAKKRKVVRKNRNFELLKRIERNNQKLKTLLKNKTNTPLIWEGNKKILTGKAFRGRLLNSVVSTNLESPVLVEAYANQGLPFGTKFGCKGTTKHKRVITFCNKLITKSKETAISVQILNMDGSAGLLGTYDDGKEDLIAGALASEMAQGVLSIAQSKIQTPYGLEIKNNIKNQLMQGLINSSKTTSEILIEDMKTKEPIVVINAGKEVLIYFMEALNDY